MPFVQHFPVLRDSPTAKLFYHNKDYYQEEQSPDIIVFLRHQDTLPCCACIFLSISISCSFFCMGSSSCSSFSCPLSRDSILPEKDSIKLLLSLLSCCITFSNLSLMSSSCDFASVLISLISSRCSLFVLR